MIEDCRMINYLYILYRRTEFKSEVHPYSMDIFGRILWYERQYFWVHLFIALKVYMGFDFWYAFDPLN